MNRTNNLLLIALIIQILIGGFFYWQGDQQYKQPTKGIMANVNILNVSQLTISDKEDTLTLNKKGDSWLMKDLLVSQQKVVALFEKFDKVRPSWPVGTSKESQQRFEVSEEKFQKKVVISIENQEKVLYLGTSPGYRQVHVRFSDSDDIYSINLNTFDFPTDKNNWLDKTILTIKEDIQSLETKGYKIEKEGEEWQEVQQSSDSQSVDQNIVKTLIKELKRLSIIGVSEEKELKDPNEKLKIITGSVTHNYAITKKDEDYLIQKIGESNVYKISKTVFEALTKSPLTSI